MRRVRDGITGEEIMPLRPLTVGALRAEVDGIGLTVTYRQADGTEAFRDLGPLIVMSNKSQDVLEAAMRVAAQKFGGRVEITGSEEFKERAARMAARLGIVVDNADLRAIVADEQRRFAGRTRTIEDRRSTRPPRSRGLER
jgi:hypothetical protein